MPVDNVSPIPKSRTQIPVAIIGAGQAGLSASWYLCREGVEHVVLERNTRFHAWKKQRWDSFCLVTPNWQCKLPGFPYNGGDPEGFMVKDDIVDYVEAFATGGTRWTRMTGFGPPRM